MRSPPSTRQYTLRCRIAAVAGRAQWHSPGAGNDASVGAPEGVWYPSEQEHRSRTAWARWQVADRDVDASQEATAIPGMLLSSPSRADETVTENRSIAHAVSRLL